MVFLERDPLRNTLFNFYTNLRRASQPSAGFRRAAMLRTLQDLNAIYGHLKPAVQQALRYTKAAAREETQNALDHLTNGAADSAVGLLLGWNRVITSGTSEYVIAPSFTADMILLAKRLEHAHLVVLLINYDVPAWYRTTYEAIQATLNRIEAFATNVWDNFTNTAGLIYLALKIAAGLAAGYVTYTLTANVLEQGVFTGTGSTYRQLRSRVPRAKALNAGDSEGSDDE